MTRRLSIIALVLLEGLAVSTLAFFYFRAPFAVRAYQRIELGMTEAEAEAVVGMPVGTHFGTHPPQLRFELLAMTSIARRIAPRLQEKGPPPDELPLSRDTRYWAWDDYVIQIAVDDGKVIRTELMAMPTTAPTLFERLRQWMGF